MCTANTHTVPGIDSGFGGGAGRVAGAGLDALPELAAEAEGNSEANGRKGARNIGRTGGWDYCGLGPGKNINGPPAGPG